jgi:2-methylisocitrate lyase-like PEP mutase family enzyme
MTGPSQVERAEALRALHRGPSLLLLPNAWDAMSARVFAASGFAAVATTSAGMAWALGYPDGEQAPWPDLVAATARVVRAAGVPVTADIEAGYGATTEQLAASVTDIVRAGAVGINLEDSQPKAGFALRPIEDAVVRIKAARAAGAAAGVPLVINARVDLYLTALVGASAGLDEATRFAETVARGRAYLAAGADCVYPIGMSDPKTIAAYVAALAAPVNIMAHAAMPDVETLQRLGVQRVSIASTGALVALAATQKLAEGLRSTGRFDVLASGLTYRDAQRLFA